MGPKKSGAQPKGISAILALNPVDGSLEERIDQAVQAVSSSRIPATWILVGNARTLEALRKNGTARRIHAQLLEQEPFQDSWSAFRDAALLSKSKWLLLLPSQDIDPQNLRDLLKMSGKAQWIFSSRGTIPAWMQALVQRMFRAPAVDLGAPSLVLREKFARVAAWYPARGFLMGPKLYAAGVQGGLSSRVLPAPDRVAPIGPLQVLGLDPVDAKKRLWQLTEKTLIALIACFVGIQLCKQVPALGLPLLGFGAIYLATLWGRS